MKDIKKITFDTKDREKISYRGHQIGRQIKQDECLTDLHMRNIFGIKTITGYTSHINKQKACSVSQTLLLQNEITTPLPDVFITTW